MVETKMLGNYDMHIMNSDQITKIHKIGSFHYDIPADIPTNSTVYIYGANYEKKLPR